MKRVIQQWLLACFICVSQLSCEHQNPPSLLSNPVSGTQDAEVSASGIFPEIHDLNSVQIALSRSGGCLGECPSYIIQVQGDGTIAYSGVDSVALTGRHRAIISQEMMQALLEAFRVANFWSIRKRAYNISMFDAPTYTIAMKVGNLEKEVTHWFGSVYGLEDGDEFGHELYIDGVTSENVMLEKLTDLEAEIDRISGSDRWTKGNSETVVNLKAEHWNFRSEEAGRALARMALYGSADAVRDMVAAGAPVDGYVEVGPYYEPGSTALERAAYRGDVKMLQVLLDAGAARNNTKLLDAAITRALNAKQQRAEQVLRDYESRHRSAR